ncbi:LytR/AlgR family response regulator transcription factor [Noviherbaspirillum aridicola]|uniref:Positive alginate biosynthesis regulatory protein n=1 Tax=Noviherbaspirillum aridicola TaxID=2849687 RepID=A0ABQ4QA03_9BURK|nr:LytTR family DNA-binding domain-containing protein [Noviherbaspirillum aridicola]GIZ54033.1 positive alginate biosynthesis regulatory protein [Noviherbaspirillum aridicola]
MTPRLLIVDDEAPARSRMKTLLADIEEECPHTLAGEAGTPQEALDLAASRVPDIVLLDVQMPGMTGIELARHLAAAPSAPAVIFVTAFDEFALKAFEVHALDYLLKPVRAARLAEAIRRAASLRAPAPLPGHAAAAAMMGAARRHFSVPERGRVRLVPVDEVLYLKAEQKYLTLRTAAQEFLIEESLTSIEEELGSVFIRVHRNALVARAAIAGVERAAHPAEGDGEAERGQDSWQVVLRGIDERLPISRRQWGVVKGLVR